MKPSAAVLDHCRNPRNAGLLDPILPGLALGAAGSMAEGLLVRFQIRVENGLVAEARFQAFGCAGAIAAASLLTEESKGLPLAGAQALPARRLIEALELPEAKARCAERAIEALRAAIANFRRNEPRNPGPGESSEKTAPTLSGDAHAPEGGRQV